MSQRVLSASDCEVISEKLYEIATGLREKGLKANDISKAMTATVKLCFEIATVLRAQCGMTLDATEVFIANIIEFTV